MNNGDINTLDTARERSLKSGSFLNKSKDSKASFLSHGSGVSELKEEDMNSNESGSRSRCTNPVSQSANTDIFTVTQ